MFAFFDLVGKTVLSACLVVQLFGCTTTPDFTTTVETVDRDRFMGDWYVIAGRFTFLEDGAHNSIETYTWNEEEQQVDITFKYNDQSFDGEIKELTQTGWIIDETTNATWEVSPFWPIRFGYLVLALAEDYSWTAVGVPNQDYLWIMSRLPRLEEGVLDDIVARLTKMEYSVKDIVTVPHSTNEKP